MDAQYYIDGEGRDEAGARYFRIALPESAITISVERAISEPGQLHTALTNAGVNCISAESKKALIETLQSFQGEEASFRVATKIGHFRSQFILPDKTIGLSIPPAVAVLDHLDQAMLAKYRTSTLSQWQRQIATAANGNSRLMFAAALAFIRGREV